MEQTLIDCSLKSLEYSLNYISLSFNGQVVSFILLLNGFYRESEESIESAFQY